jgi:hypothetical protein
MENKEKLLAIIEKAKEEKSIAEKAIIYADAKIEVATEMLKDDEAEVVEEQTIEENII